MYPDIFEKADSFSPFLIKKKTHPQVAL